MNRHTVRKNLPSTMFQREIHRTILSFLPQKKQNLQRIIKISRIVSRKTDERIPIKERSEQGFKKDGRDLPHDMCRNIWEEKALISHQKIGDS